jgi:sugar phosphate isomerase/epimerase
MCYGYDGQGELARSSERAGINRRGFLAAAVGATAVGGLALAGGGTAAAAVAPQTGRGPGGKRPVPRGHISIQLWTVRADLFVDYDSTIEYLADAGYPRVELALGYFGRTAAELKEFYDNVGIWPSSSHDGISGDAAALETKIANAVTLEQAFIVVPFLQSADPDQWRRWAEQMNNEAAAAKQAGLRYGYHNHAHEFLPLANGDRPWDILTSELDPKLVHLEVDLYWVVTGGIQSGDGVSDPTGFAIDVIRDAPQKVRQYHVKDRDPATGDMCDLGTGMIEFPRIFAAHRVQEYIVENDTPDVTPEQTARVGYDYLRTVRF